MELTKRKSLGQILIGLGIISQDQLEHALIQQKRTGKRLGETLEEMGVCTREDVEWAISQQLDISVVRINRNILDPEAIEKIPGGMARAFRMFPTLLAGDELHVVMADPTQDKAIKKVESLTGLDVVVSIGLPSEIDQLVTEYYDAPATDEEVEDLGEGIASELFVPEELVQIYADNSAETFIQKILERAVLEQSEAICLRSEDDVNMVEFRQNGIFKKMIELSPAWYRQTVWKFLRLVEFTESERMTVRRGSLPMTVEERSVMFDVSYYSGAGGEMLVLSPTLAGETSAIELNLAEEEGLKLKRYLPAARGVFICGAHPELGRLLSKMLEKARFPEKVVLVGRKNTDLPFWPGKPLVLDGLDEKMKLDEMYERASGFSRHIYFMENSKSENPVEAGFKAALDGRLILAPFEGAESAQILTTLIGDTKSLDMFIFGIAGTMVFKQVKILCDSCKSETTPAPELLRMLKIRPRPEQKFFKAGRCEACSNSGYSGSSFIIEMVLFDADFKKKFLEAGGEVRRTLLEMGVKTLHDRAIELVTEGKVSIRDIM